LPAGFAVDSVPELDFEEVSLDEEVALFDVLEAAEEPEE
jgi:hypothetical protein